MAEDKNVSRLFRYFYRHRPSFSRYTVTWDVGKVLRFLAKWHPPENLSMRQLTLKTVALIALTSSDRAQTLHVLDIQYLNYVPQGLEFLVPSILKHYRAGRPARRVLCVKWDDPSLNVCNYVEFYLMICSFVAVGNNLYNKLWAVFGCKRYLAGPKVQPDIY